MLPSSTPHSGGGSVTQAWPMRMSLSHSSGMDTCLCPRRILPGDFWSTLLLACGLRTCYMRTVCLQDEMRNSTLVMSFETLESARPEAYPDGRSPETWEARKEGWEEEGGRGGLQAGHAA